MGKQREIPLLLPRREPASDETRPRFAISSQFVVVPLFDGLFSVSLDGHSAPPSHRFATHPNVATHE